MVAIPQLEFAGANQVSHQLLFDHRQQYQPTPASHEQGRSIALEQARTSAVTHAEDSKRCMAIGRQRRKKVINI
jgi:hypothetical protein